MSVDDRDADLLLLIKCPARMEPARRPWRLAGYLAWHRAPAKEAVGDADPPARLLTGGVGAEGRVDGAGLLRPAARFLTGRPCRRESGRRNQGGADPGLGQPQVQVVHLPEAGRDLAPGTCETDPVLVGGRADERAGQTGGIPLIQARTHTPMLGPWATVTASDNQRGGFVMEGHGVRQRSSRGVDRGPMGPRSTHVNRRIVVPRYGGPELMELVEESIPEPGPGQVRVRIAVAGVGYPDVLMREGTYPGGPKPPFTPGYEFVGTVDKLGAGVTGFELGQRVGAIPVYGSHADYLCVPAWWLVPVPAALDPAEAAIVVFNYVTAYQMLHRTAQVKKGERVLVHGAGGGVGSAILQLGRLAGLELFGTGSGAHAGVISALGATPIDYTKGSFVERIRELTGDGVDVALDGIGGRVSLGSYRALRRGGRLVMYGHYGTLVKGRKSTRRVAVFYLSGALVFAASLLPDGKRVRTFRVAKLRDRRPEWFRQDATTLFELLSEGKIEPIVAERIPLVEARRAHENLGRGGVTGKQVLICDPGALAERRG